MHLIGLFILGWVFYMSAAVVAYHPSIKSATMLYYGLGLVIALLCNITWLFIARHSETAAQIYYRGLVWDSLIVGSYVLVPILFFGVRLSLQASLGLVLIVIGLFLSK